jgi:mutator protein MutT
MQGRREIHVMAGVLSDESGRVLVCQRPVGKHLAGRWEFPGGKLEKGEAPLAGLRRELAEELGLDLVTAEPLIRLAHDYSDRRVLLDVWRVTEYAGAPQGLDGQVFEWVALDDLPAIDLLEADRPIITALRLPCVARRIAGAEGLARAAAGTRPEALFWDPQDAEAGSEAIRETVRSAQRAGHRVIVTGEDLQAATTAAASGAGGMLLEPTGGMVTLDSSGAFIVGAICPTAKAARSAVATGAHFLVLVSTGPAADQEELAQLIQRLGLPVYLGWYPDEGSLELARSSGAHGCAIDPCGAS